MRQATLTLSGILAATPTLFDDMVIPTELDRGVLCAKIITRSNNLEPLYPDGPYFQKAIEYWSKSRLDVWERLEATRHYDYTPIHNYDRHETEKTVRDGKYTDDRTLDRTSTLNSTGHETYSGQMDSTDTQDDTNTGTVGGYNSSTSNAPFDKQVLDSNRTHGQTESSDADRTGNEELTARDVEGVDKKEDWTDDRDLYAYGNIGVTSTQELIQQQRDVDMFNLYDVIAEEFVDEFMLLVY